MKANQYRKEKKGKNMVFQIPFIKEDKRSATEQKYFPNINYQYLFIFIYYTVFS